MFPTTFLRWPLGHHQYSKICIPGMDDSDVTLCGQTPTPTTGRSGCGARPPALAQLWQCFLVVWLRNSCGLGCVNHWWILVMGGRREKCVCAGACVHWCRLTLDSLTDRGCEFPKTLICMGIPPELILLENLHYSHLPAIFICSHFYQKKGIFSTR